MKIHDFGLWFKTESGSWSTTIPQEGSFHIFYDGDWLGRQRSDFTVYESKARMVIKYFLRIKPTFSANPNRRLTLDDFEIIKSPDYTTTFSELIVS